MKFTQMSREAVCELLVFLAENEEFPSVKALKNLSTEEVSQALTELAEGLRSEAAAEEPAAKANYNTRELSEKTLNLIGSLSPKEEMLLFKSFKID